MTTGWSGRRASLVPPLVLAVGLLAGAACEDAPLVPESRRPFLYLVLNHTVKLEERTVQPAFLLTVVRADSIVYRGAERFEMRRLSGGATFEWTSERAAGPVDVAEFGTISARLSEANWLLADSATSEGLGRAGLEPGATYELVIETGGEVIRGRATIPDSFGVSVIRRDSARVAVWPSVDGAAGYVVDASGAGDTLPLYRSPTDTTYELAPSDTSVSVRAVGPNVYSYDTGPEAGRAGIEGGLGVFGAIQEARWEP